MAIELQDGENYYTRIIADAAGQTIMNVLTYRAEFVGGPAPVPTTLNFLTDLSTRWEAGILPLLGSAYNTLMYTTEQILDVVASPTAGVPVIVSQGYTELIRGGQGGKVTPPMPTYGAISARKRAVAGIGARFRGGIRVGPIVEDDTQLAPSQGNQLLPAVAQSFDSALNDMKLVSVTATVGQVDMKMQILSMITGGVIRPYTPGGSVQEVESLIVSPFISTQNTRKQR